MAVEKTHDFHIGLRYAAGQIHGPNREVFFLNLSKLSHATDSESPK